ncbi:hypothetical protein EAJ09_07335 [Bacteroides stercoris]|nr:hypothetical protein EAJ09_07335 [Bacteroides stercoris]
MATWETTAVLVFYYCRNAKQYSKMENSISIQGAPTPNGHRVTTSLILRLVNVCIAFIALVISGSADILFPLFASMGWFVSSIVLIFSARKEVYHD